MTPRTVAHQAPLSMGFSRQEYWSRWPFPPPEDLPDPGIKPVFPALAGRFLITEPPGKPSLFTVLVSLLCYVHQCVVFFDSTVILYSICLWLTSLSIIPSKSIRAVADLKTSLFLWLNSILLYAYLCVYTHTHTKSLFIHVDGHLACFCVLPNVNNATVNIGVYVF